ncbi:hypothetical protein EVG20_g6090 [Dentipellis fragilis]|uniref:Uncharacterized protein n=1 Tax=Dentipellis fragilis TaxID=205917 RepID=A0A4Y9YN33_9AGAM|nr:hypothetical protein EVG20_g6090 [Dentipellis fragilis]
MSYPLVLAQYKRDDFGAGNEQELHWALLVITDITRLSGPCFQAVDRTYRDARGKQWSPHSAECSLLSTDKCLGGVQIGSVRQCDLATFSNIVAAHPTIPKSERWNCRDYILEIIEQLLRPRGYLRADLAPRHRVTMADLLPELKQVSWATEDYGGSTDSATPRSSICLE